MSYGNLRTDQRSPLADLIPLAMPFMIRVDPTNACNYRCRYCPTGNPDLLRQVGRTPKHLSFDLFKKIVGDLEGFPGPLRKLYLYKDGEPLLHRQLPDMIRLAKESGRVQEVWTTSNGSLLNPTLSQALVDAGLDLIKLSIQGISSARYREIAGIDQDYEALKCGIADLFARRARLKVHVKIVDTGLSAEERMKFFEDFEPIADSVHIDPLMGWSMSSIRDFRLGTRQDRGPDGRPLLDREVCAFPFYTLTVNSNGSVSVCCVDWAHQTIVGNVADQTLAEIWNGPELRRFQVMHLDGRRRQNAACGDCQYLETLADDLDKDVPAILARLHRAKCP